VLQREEGKEMKIDTEIRHVTKPGANLFLELGFTPDEAKRLQAASRKQINDTRLLKQELMEELSVWIAKHHLKQAEAAEILMVSRPRVSDVVNKKTAKFTIDTLVEMLSRVGKPVQAGRLADQLILSPPWRYASADPLCRHALRQFLCQFHGGVMRRHRNAAIVPGCYRGFIRRPMKSTTLVRVSRIRKRNG
jgi:predicted XRE-type DNA-binding protein